jgi:hypothetical protein
MQKINRLRCAAVVVAAALLAACSSGGEETRPAPSGTTAAPGPVTDGSSPSPCQDRPGNLLTNPSFEQGSDPWITLAPESGFEVTQEQARCGASSAVLRMHDPAGAEGSKVYYLVQEINPAEFPDVVSGFYRVEDWNKGTVRQYVQFVIIAIGPKNFASLPADRQAPNYQIRYPLAGIQSPPFSIGNAFFKFLGRDEPAEGQWVFFQANIKEDFQNLWNLVPADYEKLRLLFEVRWDAKTANDGAPNGDVFYDDLYAGPP